MFLDLRGRTCVVVGGGEVGERKVRTLLKYGARVRLVARETTAWLAGKCAQNEIDLAGRTYERVYLEGAALVFAATDDRELNRTVAADARRLGLWCNMAADPEMGSFIVPSVMERGPVSIAASTAGLSPALARVIRQKLEREFGAEWEFFIRLLGELRKSFKSGNIREEESRRIFREIAALPVPQWLRENGRDRAFREVSEICGPHLGEGELQRIWEDLWKPFSSSLQPFAT